MSKKTTTSKRKDTQPARIPHRKTGKPRGRPHGTGFKPTDEQRALVKRLAGHRFPMDEIVMLVINPATKQPISVTTLQSHFPNEIREGYAHLKMRIMCAMVRNACGVVKEDKNGDVVIEEQGNVTAGIWLQKTLYGARELMDVIPPKIDDDQDNVIDAARRVAFTLAMGARAAQKKDTPKP